MPAGRVDVGDTIEGTAVKEAKEETGFDVELVRKIGIFQEEAVRPPCHAFEAKITGGTLEWPEDEILDAKWLDLAELMGMKEKLRGPWVLDSINMMERKE